MKSCINPHLPSAETMNNAAINPKIVLFIAAFAAFIATFNETYLNVAFTPIAETFSIDLITVKWLTTAYMLGAAVVVPISAYLYRSIKTRHLFFASLILLIAGSVVCALSVNFPMLLIGRIIQSVGTGILIPLGMNINVACAPRQKLGKYIGIVIAMTTIGPSASILAAGGLLSYTDWRMLFWVYAVLSLICLICGMCLLKNIAELNRPKFDILSYTLIGLGLIGVMYGISVVFTGNHLFAVLSFVTGLILLLIFAVRQKRPAPLISLRPFRLPVFTIGLIINMLAIIAMFAMNILLPYYLQTSLGVEPIIASLTIFPAILLSSAFAPAAGRLCDLYGPKVIVPAGFILMGVFSALLAAFITTGNIILFALLYIPVICGSSIILGPAQSFILSRLPREENPHGVVLLSTGFQIAGCIGSSVFTGVYAVFETASGELAFTAAAGLTAVCMLCGFVLSLAVSAIDRRERRAE